MPPKRPGFPDDKTARERRKHLSKQEIKDLELAGGVEGGMRAGSAGGPSEDEQDRTSQKGSPANKR